MTQISSFKIGAGIAGIAAFVKLSVFAIALMLLGPVNAPHATNAAAASIPAGSHIFAQN
jgi:hypothetical protein